MNDVSRAPEDVKAAIDRVLEAERKAIEAVEDCRHQAKAEIAAARDEARRILERADTRIGALHARCLERVAQTIGALEAETQAVPLAPPLAPGRDGRVEKVLRRLAAEISGANG